MTVASHLMRLSVEGFNYKCYQYFLTITALDCTALHTGKDLAVSPLLLPRELFLNVRPGIP